MSINYIFFFVFFLGFLIFLVVISSVFTSVSLTKLSTASSKSFLASDNSFAFNTSATIVTFSTFFSSSDFSSNVGVEISIFLDTVGCLVLDFLILKNFTIIKIPDAIIQNIITKKITLFIIIYSYNFFNFFYSHTNIRIYFNNK